MPRAGITTLPVVAEIPQRGRVAGNTVNMLKIEGMFHQIRECMGAMNENIDTLCQKIRTIKKDELKDKTTSGEIRIMMFEREVRRKLRVSKIKENEGDFETREIVKRVPEITIQQIDAEKDLEELILGRYKTRKGGQS